MEPTITYYTIASIHEQINKARHLWVQAQISDDHKIMVSVDKHELRTQVNLAVLEDADCVAGFWVDKSTFVVGQ